jgi:hypothetical protein
VIVRLLRAFPGEVIVCAHDYAWKDHDHFVQRGAYEGTVRVAENDARRRGPVFIFRLRTSGDQVIRGKAERYVVHIWSDREIPEDLVRRFTSFLTTLVLGRVEIAAEHGSGS